MLTQNKKKKNSRLYGKICNTLKSSFARKTNTPQTTKHSRKTNTCPALLGTPQKLSGIRICYSNNGIWTKCLKLNKTDLHKNHFNLVVYTRAHLVFLFSLGSFSPNRSTHLYIIQLFAFNENCKLIFPGRGWIENRQKSVFICRSVEIRSDITNKRKNRGLKEIRQTLITQVTQIQCRVPYLSNYKRWTFVPWFLFGVLATFSFLGVARR